MFIDRLRLEGARTFSRGKRPESAHREVGLRPSRTPPAPADTRLPRPRLPIDE